MDFYASGYSSGPITFKATTFAGKGAAGSTTLTTYDMKPGVLIEKSSNIKFEGCTFSGYIKNLYGSAVSLFGSSVTFTGCNFRDNYGSSGAAMAVFSGSTISMATCTFSGNRADEAS